MNLIFALAIQLGIFSAGTSFAAKSSTQELMQRKLANAQALLKGIALEDYKLILTKAENLREIGLAASWHKLTSPDYQHFANSFVNVATNMVEQAKKKNLEGVAMSYIGLTFSCMQCHNHVRAGRPKP